MSNFTKNIKIEPDGAGYKVTITTVIDGSQIIKEETFPDAESLKAYTSEQIDMALLAEAIHQLQANRQTAEVNAWLRALAGVNQKDYEAVRRPQLIEWMQKWRWQVTLPGEISVNCEITGGGQMVPVRGGQNVIRVTPIARRKWKAGTGQGFFMVSANQQTWEGYDDQGERYVIEKIKKV